MRDGKLIIEWCITKAVADIMGPTFDEAMVTRACHRLMGNHVCTVKKFAETTDEELMSMRGVGEKIFSVLAAAREYAKQKYEFACEYNKDSYLLALRKLKDLFEKYTNDGIFVEHVMMSIN